MGFAYRLCCYKLYGRFGTATPPCGGRNASLTAGFTPANEALAADDAVVDELAFLRSGEATGSGLRALTAAWLLSVRLSLFQKCTIFFPISM